MSEINIYNCTPREARSHIIDCLESDCVPFVQSSPGVGKSSIFKSIAKDANLKLIDHRLSTSAPEDLSGLPRFDEEGYAYFSPFRELFPTDKANVPDGFAGWFLFLDEFNSAKKDVQAAAYKLVLDRQTGQQNLHEKVVIGCAGNKATDRAITNQLSTAMQSRVIHIEMRHDYREWLEDVAIPNNYDERIIAFISYYPELLMDFRPDHNEKTFCCPRTWEFMNRLIKNKTFNLDTVEGVEVYEMDKKISLYGGTITSGVAANFVQFSKVFHTMMKVPDILKDPKNCALPGSLDGLWATIAHIMSYVTEENFADLADYANRFQNDMKILFYRSILVRHPNLRQHPAMANAFVQLSRYLNGN